MRRRLGLAAALGLAAVGSWNGLSAADPQVATTTASAASAPQLQTITTYCVGCHNERAKTGGLSLAAPELANIATHPDIWEKVLRKVRGGMMPPPGVPQPDDAT